MTATQEETEQEFAEELQAQGNDAEKGDKLLKLPLSRIRTIIKQDPEVHLASHDSVVLIAKATVSAALGLYGTYARTYESRVFINVRHIKHVLSYSKSLHGITE